MCIGYPIPINNYLILFIKDRTFKNYLPIIRPGCANEVLTIQKANTRPVIQE